MKLQYFLRSYSIERRETKKGTIMINIIVADDHPLIRQGLRKVATATDEIVVGDEAGTSAEVLNKLRKDAYDVVVLDISMPGKSGLEVIKEIKKEFPKTAVLVLSAYPEEQYALRALRSGASGYLTKETAVNELIGAVKKVAGGGKYISASIAEELAFAIQDDSNKAPHEKLSNREYQVMCMIASGKTLRDVAEELFLSVKTIGTHRSRILAKMNMKNNAELTYYAVKLGLVQ